MEEKKETTKVGLDGETKSSNIETMLELVKVKKIYKTKSGDTSALNEISLSFPKRGMVFITGKSGSGKTTLLNIIGGLDGFDSGNIILDGKDFKDFTQNDYNSYRNTFIGFIFQEYNLLSEYSVQKNLELATELQGVKKDKQEIDDILKIVDLEGLNYRRTNELSGGQKQRVAIARALIKNPKIIMADEPTGALDSATGISVITTLKKLSRDKLVIVVSHDLELAEKYADRIIRLVDGNIVEDVLITENEIKANVAETNASTTVKLGADLTDAETELLLKGIREKREIKFVDQVTVRTKSQTPPLEKPKTVNPPKFIKSKMKTKSSMGLGFRALGVKPIRLIFTVFLAVVAFALFGLFDTIAAYDDSRAISNLLRTSEYDSVVLSPEERGDGFTYNIRIGQEEIDKLNANTKYNFRPLYEINDKGFNGITDRTYIIELKPESTETVAGSSYYQKFVDDFIEFSEQEISNKIIDKGGFNYEIVYGRYPTLPSKMVDEEGNKIKGARSFMEVAISTYTAENMLYYLSLDTETSPNLNGKKIEKTEDLLDATFSVRNYHDGNYLKYKIVGIIDCGEIPEKFNELKLPGSSKSRSALKSSFDTFINSGAYLKLFVPTGYVQEWRTYINRTNTYFFGGNNVTVKSGDIRQLNVSYFGRTAFYNAEENIGKVVFFDQNQTSASANEVIIPAELIRSIYKEKLDTLDINAELNAAINTLFSSMSYEGKANAIRNTLSVLFARTAEEGPLKLTLENTNVVNDQTTCVDFNIVGVYVDVNGDHTGDALFKTKPLMFSNAGFERIGVPIYQGEYARIISPAKSGVFATNGLANNIVAESGLAYSWYQNTILETIKSNRQTLQDFSNLFLYISVALAVFSVFMLFNYISSSIVSKRQSIGVLRALGSNGKDIFTMFFTESMVISIINALVACLVAFVGCIFVNMYIKTIMNLTLNFAIFGFRQIGIIFGISIVTGILSSLIPIIRICKEKPIELIRKD